MKKNTISHFNEGTLLEEFADHAIYQLKLENGSGTATVHLIYPGIEIAELDMSSYQYLPDTQNSRRILEINFCSAGRFECRMKDGCSQYMGEGDLFLSPLQNHCDSIEFPLGYYRGFVITIDLDQIPNTWEGIFAGTPDDLCETLMRYFFNDDCFMILSKEYIGHIFSGMESSPKEAKVLFYRLKIMELLLFLYYFDPSSEKQKRIYAKQQINTVKQIHKRITEQLSSRFTIEALAKEYCISATAIKTHFKEIYGQSITVYMKNYRISKAAVLLRETEQTISDISNAVGYESQSKFAAAFKEIMKTTPLEYRKAHRISE